MWGIYKRNLFISCIQTTAGGWNIRIRAIPDINKTRNRESISFANGIMEKSTRYPAEVICQNNNRPVTVLLAGRALKIPRKIRRYDLSELKR